MESFFKKNTHDREKKPKLYPVHIHTFIQKVMIKKYVNES